MRVLSLFSGVGGLDQGLETAGHEIVGMCEVDEKPRSVLRYHWPDTFIYDDVTTLDGSLFHGRVDLVAGGSPCQDLSVAGRRAGLDGERSGLFWHQCRIAAQSGARWVLWENVAGALSSNNGEDFAAVLWGLTGCQPAVPEDGWRSVGVCVGPERTAVWRLLDARWFGVPQRRRRVYVVAGPRGECGPEILLEPESCPRNPDPSVAARPGAAGSPGGSSDKHRRDEFVGSLTAMDGWERPDNAHAEAGWLVPALTTRCGETFDDQQTTQLVTVETFARTHRATSDQDADIWAPTDTAPTLNTNDTDAGPARSTVLAAFDSTFGANSNVFEDGVTPPLKVGSGLGIPSPPAVQTELAVRRLTPRECERLMGWPDDWTRWSADGTEIADGPRYKMCGNGVVSPVAAWIGGRLPC